VVKLYDPAGASPLFPNDPVAEAAALRAFAPHGLAPRLRAQGAGWLTYDHTPGHPWAPGDPAEVAALLLRLHAIRLPAPPPFRRLAPGPTALRAQAQTILAQCRAPLPAPEVPPEPPPAPEVPLHGDPVPGNILCTAQGLQLIDWQCPAFGDPAEDHALFLSPAMQWLYRGAPLTADEEARFLAALPPDRRARLMTLRPLFRWRMAAHCLWRAERGAPGYAEALRLELAS
jgi:hypothetical protein